MKKVILLFWLVVHSLVGNAQINVNEGYEAATLPSGWIAAGFGGVPSNLSSCTGSQSMRMSAGGSNYLGSITTSSYTSNGYAINVSFKYKSPSAASATLWLYYQIGTQPWVTAATITNNMPNACQQLSATIPSGTVANGSTIKFKMEIGTASSMNIYFDDFSAIQSSGAAPAAPIAASPQSVCPFTEITALSATGTALRWYRDAAGVDEVLLNSGHILGTRTYYVTQTINGFESPKTAVSVIVNPTPATPTAATQTFCVGSGAKFSDIVTTGSNIRWFTSLQPQFGTEIAPNTLISQFGSYYFTQTINGCESARGSVIIYYNATQVPFFTQVAPISPGTPLAALPTTSNNGISGTWSPALNNTTTTTYTFTPTVANCISIVTMTIIVNTPLAPSVSAVSSTNITSTAATINYSLNANNAATTSVVDYGLSASSLLSATTGSTASGNTATAGTSQLTGLTPNTQYFYKVRATNSAGTTNSAVASFTTAVAQLDFSNLTSSAITGTSATVSVTLANVCPGATFRIQYSTTSTFGAGTQDLLQSSNVVNGVNTINLTGLTTSTLYYFRFYAVANQACNAAQIVSTEANFTTLGAAVTPTFTQVAPICSGATLATLPTTSNNGITGTWSPALNNTATTTYSFAPTLGQNASTATMTVTVNSVAAPTGATTQSFVQGSTISNLAVSPSNVVWYATNANALSNTNPLPSTTVLANATSYYAVNVSGSCRSTPFAVTVSVTLGTDTFSKMNVMIYPNPAKNVLNIEMTNQIKSIEIYNIQGQKVLSSNQKQVNVSDLGAGIYMIKIQDIENNIATKKIVIQ